MEDPARAERHWLVMAVASLWVISVGGESDATPPASTFDALPPDHLARRLSKQRKKQRKISCFARGLMMLTMALLQGESIPTGQLVPFFWPLSPPETEGEGGVWDEGEKTYP